MKRSGKRQKPVKRQNWKKASVLLTEGQTIDAFQIGGETQGK
jgi:ribosomal protein L23